MQQVKISIVNPRNEGLIDEVRTVSFDELPDIICQHNWSPSVFNVDKEGVTRRNNESFSGLDLIVLDVDEGCAVDEAKEKFKDYRHIITATRHHQKEKILKSGKVKPPCDRFRVVIPLDKSIASDKVNRVNWRNAARQWSFIDKNCKDEARYYYKSSEVLSVSTEGKCFEVQEIFEEEVEPTESKPRIAPAKGEKGTLRTSTWDFIRKGADQGWRSRLYAATMNLKEQNYTEDEAKKMLEPATVNYDGSLDEDDLALIEDAYANRKCKYEFQPKKKEITSKSGSVRVPTKTKLLAEIEQDKKIYKEALKSPMPFICSAFDDHYKLINGLTGVGAVSGDGKSTTAANIAAHIIKKDAEGRKILFISNEENTRDVYARVSCIVRRVDWKKYKRNELSPKEIAKVDATIESLIDRIKVYSVSGDGYDVTKLEDVIAICELAKENSEEYGLVIIDYFQAIDKSDRNLTYQDILREFGRFLKAYAPTCSIPVVLFFQLKESNGFNNGNFKERIEWCKEIYNHAAEIIEIIPYPERSVADFKIRKSREYEKCSIGIGFVDGRYEVATEQQAEILKNLRNEGWEDDI